MRSLLLALILTGCASQTTTVDRDQAGYTMPGLYTVTVAVIPLAAVRVICAGDRSLGCSYWSDSRSAFVWLSAAEFAGHEFDHLIYGPKHIKE